MCACVENGQSFQRHTLSFLSWGNELQSAVAVAVLWMSSYPFHHVVLALLFLFTLLKYFVFLYLFYLNNSPYGRQWYSILANIRVDVVGWFVSSVCRERERGKEKEIMQRDAYAALIKKRNKFKIPLRIFQMNGKVFQENVFDEVFKGYRLRRLVLMTHTSGQDPNLPRLPHDIIVPNFQFLLSIHQPHYQYQLLPLISADIESFAAMQAICATPGSPFTIADRLDAQGLTYRFSNGCAGRDRICEFLKPHTNQAEQSTPTSSRRLPINGVAFQGLLQKKAKVGVGVVHSDHKNVVQRDNAGNSLASSPPSANRAKLVSAAVLLTTHEGLTDVVIQQRVMMRDFFESPIYWELSGTSDVAQRVRGVEQRMHMMAVKRRISGNGSSFDGQRARANLLALARKHNIFVYEKIDEGVYTYAV